MNLNKEKQKQGESAGGNPGSKNQQKEQTERLKHEHLVKKTAHATHGAGPENHKTTTTLARIAHGETGTDIRESAVAGLVAMAEELEELAAVHAEIAMMSQAAVAMAGPAAEASLSTLRRCSTIEASVDEDDDDNTADGSHSSGSRALPSSGEDVL